jgi:hypothetical protein
MQGGGQNYAISLSRARHQESLLSEFALSAGAEPVQLRSASLASEARQMPLLST